MAQQSDPKATTGVTTPVVVPAQAAAGETAIPQPTPAELEVIAASKQLMEAFNKGEAAVVLSMFLPDGEIIDEEGTVYLGQDEIGALLKAFYERFPGVKTMAEIESIRLIGGIALVDGTRLLTNGDGKSVSLLRYTTVWKKTEAGYKVASLRDVSEPIPLTPHEALEPIAWLVGDWVNEGTDGKVQLQYRWDEDGNFLVGEIAITGTDGGQVMKSTQKIVWDASEGHYRSWTFDSDGGFGESIWEESETGWVMHSKAVSPEGVRGTALMKMTTDGNDRFIVTVSHRMTGGIEEPEYSFTVVKRPPQVGK